MAAKPERLNKALSFIDDHIDQTLTLDQVAAASHVSKYHFHRQFQQLMGETLNDYIRRLRLERAANLIMFTSEYSITDVAYQCGFSSSANFSKAFKGHFGINPTTIRQPPASLPKQGRLAQKYDMKLDPELLARKPVAAAASPTQIAPLPMQHLCSLASPKGYDLPTLFATWRELIAWGDQHGLEETKQIRLAICRDNPLFTPVEHCRYEANLVIPPHLIPQIQPPFFHQTMPAGLYASFHYDNKSADSAKFHLSIYSHWLPGSGYQADDYPLVEQYINDADSQQLQQDSTNAFTKMNALIKVHRP